MLIVIQILRELIVSQRLAEPSLFPKQKRNENARGGYEREDEGRLAALGFDCMLGSVAGWIGQWIGISGRCHELSGADRYSWYSIQ